MDVITYGKSFETQRIDFKLIKAVDSEKLEIVKEHFNFAL